jgi:hypothetical protein
MGQSVSSPIVIFLDVHDVFIRHCNVCSLLDADMKPLLTVQPYFTGMAREGADDSCVQNLRRLWRGLASVQTQL